MIVMTIRFDKENNEYLIEPTASSVVPGMLFLTGSTTHVHVSDTDLLFDELKWLTLHAESKNEEVLFKVIV